MKTLAWNNIGLVEVVTEAAYRLRQAMHHSDGECEVKRLVDAKLLEMLWCPFNTWTTPKHLWKDVVRSDLAALVTPDRLWRGSCDWHCETDLKRCARCHAGGLLARVLLGPMDSFFETERSQAARQSPLLWVVAKLYDQLGGTNSYRTLSDMSRGDDEFRIFQLLYRMPELDYAWFTKWMVDFSALLRDAEDKIEIDYCLVCTEEDAGRSSPETLQRYGVRPIMAILEKERDITALRSKLASLNSPYVSDLLAQRLLTSQTLSYRREEALRRKRDCTTGVPKWLGDTVVTRISVTNRLIASVAAQTKAVMEAQFYKTENQLPPRLRDTLKQLICDIGNRILPDAPKKRPMRIRPSLCNLANYFIWLRALHPELGSYTVRYAANYRLMPGDASGADGKHDRLLNPCLVIASRMLPSSRLLAATRVSLTQCLGPLEDYYAIKRATQAGQQSEYVRWSKVMGHELTKVYDPLANLLVPEFFFKLRGIDQRMVLDVALEALTVADMWTATGKNHQAVATNELTNAAHLKTALERCCEHAWKFHKIKAHAAGLESNLKNNRRSARHFRHELASAKRYFAISVDEKNSAAWGAGAQKGWQNDGGRPAAWLTAIVLAAFANAFKNGDLHRPIEVTVSFPTDNGSCMVLRVANACNVRSCKARFRAKYPAGLSSPKKGTFLVLDQCGQALYDAIGMHDDYDLSRFCSLTFHKGTAEVALRFPIGRIES